MVHPEIVGKCTVFDDFRVLFVGEKYLLSVKSINKCFKFTNLVRNDKI